MDPEIEIAEYEALIDTILKGIQDVIQSGESIPDEFQRVIANELNYATQRITELQSSLQPQQRQPIPEDFNPPIGSDLLWILAGGKEDAFINYLRTYPDQGLNQLLTNPELLNNTIQHLKQTIPIGAPTIADGVKKAPIESSNIYGFKYDPKSGRLLVRFQSGSVYGYDGVPGGVFNVFQQGAVPAKTDGKNKFGQWWQGKMPSLGAAFYELIRQGGYPYRRLK